MSEIKLPPGFQLIDEPKAQAPAGVKLPDGFELIEGPPAGAPKPKANVSDFRALPSWKQLPVVAADTGRMALDGITAGYSDKVVAKVQSLLSGRPYDEVYAQVDADTDAIKQRSGVVGTAAQVGGAVMGMKGAGALASRVAPRAAAALNATMPRRILTQTAVGAGYGAADAGGHDTSVATGAGIGALAGAGGQAGAEMISGGLRAGGQLYKRMRGQVPARPTPQGVRAASEAAYKAADDAGVAFSQKGMDRMRDEIMEEFRKLGQDDVLHPAAARVLELSKTQTPTLQGLENLRRIASSAYDPTKRHQNKLLEKVVKRIDRFVEGAMGDEVIMGDPQAGAKALQEARSYWSRFRKADEVANAIERGQLKAATQASGGNTENAVRQEIRRLILDPRKSRGWTDAERAAAMEVARGTLTNNTLRQLGRAGVQGNGVSMMFGGLGIGEAARGNPVPLALTAVGSVAKPLSTALSGRKANRLAELMLAGGNEAALLGPENVVQRLGRTQKKALSRALMAGGIVAGAPAAADEED